MPWASLQLHKAANLIAACVFAFASPSLFSQTTPETTKPSEYLRTSWHTEDGLPDGNITAIAQTPDGYLWLGTFRGLARFDGARFVAIGANEGDAAFPGGRISELFVDAQGRLWVAGDAGELGYFQNGAFVQVTSVGGVAVVGKNAPGAAAKEVVIHSTHSRGLPASDLAEDSTGTIWFRFGSAGLIRVRDGEAVMVTATNGLPTTEVLALVPDRDRKPWLLGADGLFRWSAGGWAKIATTEGSLPGHAVACPSSRDGFWLVVPQSPGTGGGQIIHLPDSPAPQRFEVTPWFSDLQRSQVTAIWEDQTGRIWIGTHWGGVMFADETGHWHQAESTGPLTKTRVLSLFQDEQGAIWVGTLGEGLHRLLPRIVKTLQLPSPNRDFLINTVCAGRSGDIWVGTDTGGVFRFTEGKWMHFGAQEGVDGPVYSILEDRHTNVWCGVGTHLLQFLNGRLGRTTEPALNAGYALALFEDREGGIWVATPRGPAHCKGNRTTLRSLGPSTTGVEIRAFGQDAAGDIWVGTIAQGAFCVRSNRVDHFGPEAGLTNPDARSVWCSGNGEVWIGTLGDGLFRFRDGKFQHIGNTDGLLDGTINGILEDGHGEMWFTTYNGLFGCSQDELSFYQRGRTPGLSCRWFSLKNGLDFRTCSGSGQPVISRGNDGRIWFSNQSSLGVLEPQAGIKRGRSRKLLVDSVVVDGEAGETQPNGSFRVPSGFRSLEIHYTSPDLISPASLRFRYRMQGYEDEWVEAGERRVAYYNHVPPGQYQFEIMAGGPGENWRQWSRNFTLDVVPRFYELRRVQVGGSLALLAILAGSVWYAGRVRLRRRLEKIEAQNALERERGRIARDLHDDLGAGLAEVVLLGELAREDEVTAVEMKTHVSDMTEKTRQLVAAMDEIVWTVNPRNDSIPNLASYVAEHARKFFSSASIRCRLDIMPELPALPVPAAARHNLFLAVKEALHNVLKHSGAGEVWLRMHWAAGGFRLEVQDDGQGFDSNGSTHHGDGLENMRHRLESVGGQTLITSQRGHGTTVCFSLPVTEK
jgi:signal transduction histidine kinase/ligand-binding sensor domain-containing protein